MGGLINRASALFQQLTLSPNDRYPHTLRCVRIHLYQDGHTDADSPTHDILCPINAPPDGCVDRTFSWASLPPPKRAGTQLAGMLRLVILTRDEHQAVGVHMGTFKRLFDLFGIDPYMKYLVARSVDGYYTSLPRLTVPPCGVDGEASSCRSFYVGVRDSHVMLWSCYPQGGPDGAAVMSVIAICQGERVEPLEREARTFASVVGHPAMPVLACCSRIAQDVDGFVESTLCTVKTVEEYTGLSPNAAAQCCQVVPDHSGPGQRNTERGNAGEEVTSRDSSAVSTARLGEMSGWMSEASVKLAQYSNHLGLVRGVIQNIREPTFEHICNGTVEDVAKLLVETSSMTLDFVRYLEKRVEVQHTVLANLIARNEAEMAFQLALDSERIAESTANDGFAMMTIAIMTMFFLPATFFATIFAMPILRWDEDGGGGMMMPQMWLYLELALPVTAAILVLWGFLTCWRRRVATRREQERKARMAKLRLSGSTGDRGPLRIVETGKPPESVTKSVGTSKPSRRAYGIRTRQVQQGFQNV